MANDRHRNVTVFRTTGLYMEVKRMNTYKEIFFYIVENNERIKATNIAMDDVTREEKAYLDKNAPTLKERIEKKHNDNVI